MGKKLIYSIFLLFVVVLHGSMQQAVDRTLSRFEKGHDVVVKVVEKIQASQIFASASDYNFLHRVAWQMAQDGDWPWTYRQGYYGGIWQLDEGAFDETQNTTRYAFLTPIHDAVWQRFGIKWMAAKWSDLEIPFYSGLAARIFIETLQMEIPQTIELQATFWKQNYASQQHEGTIQDFIDNNKQHEQEYSCAAKRDLCFILDGSGSVGPTNFDKSLDFIWEVVSAMTLSLEQTHVSLVTYSTLQKLEFLDLYNGSEVRASLGATKYPAGGTYTGAAMTFALNNVQPSFRNQSAVLPVFMVLTDGQSTDNVVKPAKNIADKGITTISVGIGSNIDKVELLQIANGISENVFLSSFEYLDGILKLLQDSTCSTPAEVIVNGSEKVTFELEAYQSTYIKFSMSEDGVTISIELQKGAVIGYASYSETTPNSAVYDQTIVPGEAKFFPPPTTLKMRSRSVRAVDDSTSLYVGFTAGDAEATTFDLTVQSGYHASASLTVAPSSATLLMLALLNVARSF